MGRWQESVVQATIDAYRAAAGRVAGWKPEVVVITSPHVVMYSDYLHISPGKGASGDMSAFGAPQTRLEAVYDTELRQEVIRQAEAAGIRAGTLGKRDPALDHGTFLPLYFLREAGVNCPILRIGLSGFSPLEHYRVGRCVAQAVEELGRRAVFAASGDLSHKLKSDGPYTEGTIRSAPSGYLLSIPALPASSAFLFLYGLLLLLCFQYTRFSPLFTVCLLIQLPWGQCRHYSKESIVATSNRSGYYGWLKRKPS